VCGWKKIQEKIQKKLGKKTKIQKEWNKIQKKFKKRNFFRILLCFCGRVGLKRRDRRERNEGRKNSFENFSSKNNFELHRG
jgi:hypothetical protein